VAGASGFVHPEIRHSAWVAVGLLARLEATLFGPLSFDSEVGASFPLDSGDFVIDPTKTTAYEVPYVGLAAGAGLQLSFP
jgi:hypothetical protein